MTDLTKRYWLFLFGYYYPCGGLNDVKFTSDKKWIIQNEINKFCNDQYDGKDMSGTQIQVWDNIVHKDIALDFNLHGCDVREELRK
jgi:hypothetical protein